VFLDRIGPQYCKSRPKIKEVGIAAHCIARGRAEGGMSSQRIRSITMTMCSTGDKVAFGDKRSVKHVRKVVSHRKISEGSPGQCGAQGHGRSCSTTLTVSQRPLSTEHESHRKYIESGQEVSQCSSSCRWHGIVTQVCQYVPGSYRASAWQITSKIQRRKQRSISVYRWEADGRW
jgi:hypothetical protein